MQRRILAAVAAFVLAAVGAVLLISYVGGADERARASEETVQVLVADAAIPRGTPANQLEAKVSLAEVPKRLMGRDEKPLTDLAELGDTPTSTGMLPGDRLTQQRFAPDAAAAKPVGDGREQVSLTLEAQRATGGHLEEGDRVAVYLTRATDAGTASERVYGDVEVIRVNEVDGSAALGSMVTVTVALTAEQAATVIAGMYDNAVWLSLDDAPNTTPGD
ncbi:RcpC/CpaB family pilus assembly protein [Candidatus Blastococcus massiliensis]|uniref:RcpC/CpaB family pilus assembly protein n=1 Tax=Candidatus Blastococcus massiliensis TaxID=1470358 RepID=UPI0012DC1DD9|nr:RcpC/CpaB family pilus assembly protein [Candidatus Blastococcus massiliensis]